MNYLRKNWKFLLGMAIVWTLFGLSFAGISYLAALSENRQVKAGGIFATNLVRFYIWALLSPLIYQISKRIDFERTKSVFLSILAHVPLGLAFSFLHSIIYTGFIWLSDESYRERYPSIIKFFQEYVFFGSVYLGILLYGIIVITIQAFLLYRRNQAEHARAALLQTQLAEAQLQTLKMQLQPHFLFNTLHSISSLILTDPEKANEMVERLGEFLRMTLDNSDEQMVTIEDELEFLRCYLEIEQVRFGERLQVEFEIEDDTRSRLVPHLILQPLVENAVKHGISAHAAEGFISIKTKKVGDNIAIEIKNNGARKNGNSNGANSNGKYKNGKGLQNVRSRLAQIYGEDFRFELENNLENGFVVSMKVPARSDLGLTRKS